MWALLSVFSVIYDLHVSFIYLCNSTQRPKIFHRRLIRKLVHITQYQTKRNRNWLPFPLQSSTKRPLLKTDSIFTYHNHRGFWLVSFWYHLALVSSTEWLESLTGQTFWAAILFSYILPVRTFNIWTCRLHLTVYTVNGPLRQRKFDSFARRLSLPQAGVRTFSIWSVV